jgi:hypothetical protein
LSFSKDFCGISNFDKIDGKLSHGARSWNDFNLLSQLLQLMASFETGSGTKEERELEGQTTVPSEFSTTNDQEMENANLATQGMSTTNPEIMRDIKKQPHETNKVSGR